MEYRRAYWDETVDAQLVERHEREIFPLLHRRYLFAEVEHFLLYDFFTAEGQVNEDVFAYSNQADGEYSLVICHNRYAQARGWIKTSVAYADKRSGDGDRPLAQKGLGEGLGLQGGGDRYVIFRDHVTGLEYIRHSRELCEQGLYVELDAYQYHVFLDWREVEDNEWRQYAHLTGYLGGRGVPDIEEAIREVFLQPVHRPFRELVNAGALQWLIDNRVTEPGDEVESTLIEQVEGRAERLLREVKQFTGGPGDPEAVAREVGRTLEAALGLPLLRERFPLPRSRRYKAAAETIADHLNADVQAWGGLLGWLFVQPMGQMVRAEQHGDLSRSWIDEWLLGKLLAGAFQELDLDEGAAWWTVGTVKMLVSHSAWFRAGAPASKRAYQVLTDWLRDEQVRQFLQVNRHRGILWFNHESFARLLAWMLTVAAVQIAADPELSRDEVAQEILSAYDVIRQLDRAEADSSYQLEKLLEGVQS
jgi:hypothetical protein